MIGLGTAALGRPQYINIRQEKSKNFSLHTFRQQGRNTLNRAYHQGIRYFDTAPGYGMAEQLLLDWVKEKGDDSIEVATKWGYTYVANFNADATQHEVKEHSLSKLNEQWKQSGQLLPYLSTYQIHSATFETGVLENRSVLNRLADLRNTFNLIIGITTTGTNQVEVIKKALEVEVEGIVLFDAFQVTYNVLDQELAGIADILIRENKRIIIKEALANGRLLPNADYAHYNAMYKTLHHLAEKYQVGIDAIALRFCIDSIDPFKVLSGPASEKHLIENLNAEQFKLEKEELAELNGFKLSPTDYWAERKLLRWN